MAVGDGRLLFRQPLQIAFQPDITRAHQRRPDDGRGIIAPRRPDGPQFIDHDGQKCNEPQLVQLPVGDAARTVVVSVLGEDVADTEEPRRGGADRADRLLAAGALGPRPLHQFRLAGLERKPLVADLDTGVQRQAGVEVLVPGLRIIGPGQYTVEIAADRIVHAVGAMIQADGGRAETVRRGGGGWLFRLGRPGRSLPIHQYKTCQRKIGQPQAGPCRYTHDIRPDGSPIRRTLLLNAHIATFG